MFTFCNGKYVIYDKDDHKHNSIPPCAFLCWYLFSQCNILKYRTHYNQLLAKKMHMHKMCTYIGRLSVGQKLASPNPSYPLHSAIDLGKHRTGCCLLPYTEDKISLSALSSPGAPPLLCPYTQQPLPLEGTSGPVGGGHRPSISMRRKIPHCGWGKESTAAGIVTSS